MKQIAPIKFHFFGEVWTLRFVELLDASGISTINDQDIQIQIVASPEATFNTITHELMESAIYLSGASYTVSYPGPKELFIFDHTGMDTIACAVGGALFQIRKELEKRDKAVAAKQLKKSQQTK